MNLLIIGNSGKRRNHRHARARKPVCFLFFLFIICTLLPNFPVSKHPAEDITQYCWAEDGLQADSLSAIPISINQTFLKPRQAGPSLNQTVQGNREFHVSQNETTLKAGDFSVTAGGPGFSIQKYKKRSFLHIDLPPPSQHRFI